MKNERIIVLPMFKALISPVARKTWRCDLCKGKMALGERYAHYVNRQPHSVTHYRFHNECFSLVLGYCQDTKKTLFTPRKVMNWIKKKYCAKCDKTGCNVRDCVLIQASTRFLKNQD